MQDSYLKKVKGISKASLTDRYSSDNVELLEKEELKEILKKEDLVKSAIN